MNPIALARTGLTILTGGATILTILILDRLALAPGMPQLFDAIGERWVLEQAAHRTHIPLQTLEAKRWQ